MKRDSWLRQWEMAVVDAARDAAYWAGECGWWQPEAERLSLIGCSSSYVDGAWVWLSGPLTGVFVLGSASSRRFWPDRADIYPDQPKELHPARSTASHKWPLAVNLVKKNPQPHLPHRPDNHLLLFLLLQLSQHFSSRRIPLHTFKMGFADLLTDAGATSRFPSTLSV